MEYISKSGQDLIDISVEKFGSIEDGLFQILEDNPTLNLNTIPKSGQIIEVNNKNAGISQIKTYFKQKIFTVNNADESRLTASVGDFGNDFSNDFFNFVQ